MMAAKYPASLFSNVRFYILAATLCISILVASLLQLQIPSDQLFLIRTEQVFGYLCILYWYVALLISPLQKRLGDRFGSSLSYLAFSRRAIGVSAFYFALLHVGISLWGQIGGLGSLLLLPDRFLWSVGFGTIALIILLLMAATSFNRIVAFMTLPRWKWLHRLGYLGGILAMLHLWMIGTHIAYIEFRAVIFVLLAMLLWLESLRLTDVLTKKYPTRHKRKVAIGIFLWLVAMGLLLLLPTLVSSNTDHHITFVIETYSV